MSEAEPSDCQTSEDFYAEAPVTNMLFTLLQADASSGPLPASGFVMAGRHPACLTSAGESTLSSSRGPVHALEPKSRFLFT